MNYQRVYMNQIYSSSLLGQLAHMWKNQLLCDAIIRTGQVITKAHRVVLVAACPMLQSMENASSGSHLEVRLAADIKQEAVNTFLQYLYEGYMMLTEENCRDVEKVARLLQVDNVSRCCADFYKCMQSKTGTNLGGSQYKYSGQDTTDFRHVRATELQKTVQDRMLKRSSEFHRPGSPGIKRARVHRGGSPDVTVIGADKADDTASMANSYMSAPDPWDRVPRPGAMLSKGASGKSQPGVIDIVEESLELVQTEPHDKDSGGSQGTSSRVAQKTSMAISVASQFNTDPDISIVNVTGNKENSTSSQPSRGSITVSPLPIFSDSQSHREMPGPSSSSHRQQESPRQQESQMYIREHPTSTPVRQSFSNQSKPFAAGSALQTSSISSPASSGTPPMGSPSTSKSNRTSRPDSSGEDRGKDHRSASVENQDMPPDLSIVKVESNVLDDTGGLDMHVDMPEAGVMQLHPGRLPQGGEDQEEPSDTEIEDWAREEMSNEGSNVSGDQNNSWYMGTFKDPSIGKLYKQQHHLHSKKAEQGHPVSQTLQINHSQMINPQFQNQFVNPRVPTITKEEIVVKSDYCVAQGQQKVHVHGHVDTGQGYVEKGHGHHLDFQNNEEMEGYIQQVISNIQNDEVNSKVDMDMTDHKIVYTIDKKYKPCMFCGLNKTKTKSGWYAYSYYKCEKCDVPLCKGKRDCFKKYHRFLASLKDGINFNVPFWKLDSYKNT